VFFRLFVLFGAKLWWVGFALLMAGPVYPKGWGPALRLAGTVIIVPLGTTGALLAVYLLFFKGRLRCPVCGEPGEVVVYGRHPGLECAGCGIVYCKNMLTDFHVTVEPWPEEDEEDEEDEEEDE
jgi:hypothetical protein